ncbi:MAG: hypothetical protein AB7I33_11135 [Gemmatimonadales bacterium]
MTREGTHARSSAGCRGREIRILRAGFTDTPADDGLPTRGGQRLDHLFYRLPPEYRAGMIRRGPARYGSDHFPVFSWLFFRNGSRGRG